MRRLTRRWRGADFSARRAGVPVVDRGMELDARIGASPGGEGNLVPQFARLHGARNLAGAAPGEVPVVILQHGLTTRVPGFEGTLDTVENASPAVRASLSEPLTAAAGHTFTWALILTALTLFPALLLPRRREQPDALQAAQDLA